MKIMEKIWGGLGLFETVEVEEERPRHEEQEPKDNKARRSTGGSNVVNLNSVQPKSAEVRDRPGQSRGGRAGQFR